MEMSKTQDGFLEGFLRLTVRVTIRVAISVSGLGNLQLGIKVSDLGLRF